jgi:hypothetical protein
VKEIFPIGNDLRITEYCVSGRDLFRTQDVILNQYYNLVCVTVSRDGSDAVMTS